MTKKQLENKIKEFVEGLDREINNLRHDEAYYEKLKLSSKVAFVCGYMQGLKSVRARISELPKEDL